MQGKPVLEPSVTPRMADTGSLGLSLPLWERRGAVFPGLREKFIRLISIRCLWVVNLQEIAVSLLFA
jgi:hypothetical protein